MIQRVQSLFLLVVIVNCVLMIFLPFASFEDATGNYELSVTGLTPEKEMSSSKLWIMNIFGFVLLLIAALNGYAISLFKKRPLQVKVSRFGIFLSVFLFGLSFFGIDAVLQSVATEGFAFDYGLAVYLPIINILFGFLAIRYIKKDEALVRAADRLR